jgi:hypothetical protein
VETTTDEALLDGFEHASLPGLAHRDHVRLAWLYLRREPLWVALPRFCADLKRFAAQAGAPQRYHETITWAYFLLVHERREARPPEEPWDTFAIANDDLLRWNPSVLDRYYQKETLASERARRTFILPDLCLGSGLLSVVYGKP